MTPYAFVVENGDTGEDTFCTTQEEAMETLRGIAESLAVWVEDSETDGEVLARASYMVPLYALVVRGGALVVERIK